MRLIAAFAAVTAGVLAGSNVERPRPAARPTAAREVVVPPVAVPPPAASVVTEPSAEAPRRPTRLEVVRELAREISLRGCGSYVVLDENGLPPAEREKSQIQTIRNLGDGALADCATILTDPNSSADELTGVCDIICACKTRRRFVPLLVQRLAAPDTAPRGAIEFLIYALEELGDERDAWVLVALLDDRRNRRIAADSLATFGGPRELEAMNLWLVSQNPHSPFVPPVRKCRDRLEQRLAAERSPGGF